MSSINLFECAGSSMGGIRSLKLATKDINENPLDFPLDVIFKQNSDSIILLSDDTVNQIITLGNTQIQYRNVIPFNSNFVEDEVLERQGRYYLKTLSFEMPKANLNTNNQLKDFLFTSSGEFAISTMVCFVTDLNNNTWIIGYSQPFILETFEIKTGVNGEDNMYNLTYKCKSYSRVRQFETI